MEVLVRTAERQKEKLKKIGGGRNTVILKQKDITVSDMLLLAAKRTVDILFSALCIMLLFPLIIPVVYVILKFSSKGPLFFVQERIGKNGRIFRCLKFRTMHVNDDADTRQCSEDDERIFPAGRFLRATHLDELPQLLNVLVGDMSLVGPRPHMVYHDELFSALLPEYALRRQVRPGLTGLAQVKGCHGPTPDLDSIRRRTRFDLHYVRNMSAGMDMLIFVKTIAQVISGRSASC
jgi:putative colanic acid biosynthesis UDP-glucose lipid carrier transferase